MTDPPPRPQADGEPSGDPGTSSGGGTRPPTPRWVKFFGVIALLVLVLVAVLLVAGGGNHGPGRHSGSGDGGAQTGPSGAGEAGRGAGLGRRRAATEP